MGLNLDCNNDVMAEAKKKRFLVINDWQDDLLNKSKRIIVLTDFHFWVQNLDDLIEWCKIYNVHQQGMTIEFDSDEQLTMFILRWA